MLLDEVCSGQWLDELWRVEERKVPLLLGKGVEGICNGVMEEEVCVLVR